MKPRDIVNITLFVIFVVSGIAGIVGAFIDQPRIVLFGLFVSCMSIFVALLIEKCYDPSDKN